MKIWAHTLVKNEEKYLWFSMMSVIEHLDRILIWDNGSTDRTVEIIKEIQKNYPKKIDFREVGDLTSDEVPVVRQKMLEVTTADWVILVDGDEVWWDESIKEVVSLINERGNYIESLVNGYYNLIGDIFHCLPEDAGRYEIDSRRGHLTIRAMSMKIPGLHVANPHPLEAYLDESDTPVQERISKKRFHLETPSYLHFTHLRRSGSAIFDLKVSKRRLKFKYEIGINFPLDFYYPEVFFRPRTRVVPDPWERMSRVYFAKAFIQTPLKKFKRKFLSHGFGNQ